jgi:hypothetical protein
VEEVYIAPAFSTSVIDGGEWSTSLSGRFTPGEVASGNLVTIGQEAGWTPEPAWTLWRRENLALLGIEFGPSNL